MRTPILVFVLVLFPLTIPESRAKDPDEIRCTKYVQALRSKANARALEADDRRRIDRLLSEMQDACDRWYFDQAYESYANSINTILERTKN